METTEKISKWVSLASGIIAVFAAYQSYLVNESTNALQEKFSKLNYAKDSANFIRDREFKFKIYELVKEAISNKEDDRVQKAATVIVRELVSENDASFKLGLLNIIGNTTTDPAIKKETNVAIYNVEESQITNTPNINTSDFKNIVTKVDIFYLEDKQPSSELIANDVAKLLTNKYQVRVRLLPSSINERPGYNIKNTQIRFEKNEENQANDIINLITKASLGISITKRSTTNITTNYISVFIAQ